MKYMPLRLRSVIDGIFVGISIVYAGYVAMAALSTVQFAETPDRRRTALGELVRNEVVQQQVPVHKAWMSDSLCYDVLFATYKRKNPAELKISLIQGMLRRSIQLDASILTDNHVYPLCFPADGFEDGTAVLEIAGENGRPGQSPTVWLTSDISAGQAILNGHPTQKSLIYRAYARRYGVMLWGFAAVLGLTAAGSARAVWGAASFDPASAWGKRFWQNCGGPCFHDLFDCRHWLLAGAVIACTLSLAMATISRFAAHPDEGLHAASAAYYENHFLPPAVGDPAADFTYAPTRYGVSYINLIGVDYFLTGKFSAAIKSFGLVNDFRSQRMFNIFLFILLCLVIGRAKNRSIYFPVLITPQVWYIAAYVNNDFFPFVLMMLLCGELMEPDSGYNRSAEGGRLWLQTVPAGGLLGLLSISKRNYQVFVLFTCSYLVWKVLKRNRYRFSRELFQRPEFKAMILVMAYAAALFAFRTGWDICQNGWHKDQKLERQADRLAAEGFRPVDIAGDIQRTQPGLRLKEKGETLTHLIMNRGWKTLSLNSFFGVYGWMTIKGPVKYFHWMTTLAVLLLGYAAVQSVATFRAESIGILMGALGVIALMVAASVHHSWVYDFQPQGRYLFPMLGILSAMYFELRNCLNRQVTGMLVFMMFMGACWSFLFVGLTQIQKMV